MRSQIAAMFSVLILSVGACQGDSVNVPILADATKLRSPLGLKPTLTILAGCPKGHWCWTPASSPAIMPDAEAVTFNCPEACGLRENQRTWAHYLMADDSAGVFDAIKINCQNGDSSWTSVWTSYFPCWDCEGNCAGARCPVGSDCQNVPGMVGWDCRAIDCGGWEGYAELIPGANGQAKPMCKRPIPPANPHPQPIWHEHPTTTATTVDGTPYLTWDPVSGAGGYRVYRQLEWMAAPQIWYTYTTATFYRDWSTEVSGSPQSQPDPSWTTWARYIVVTIEPDGTQSGLLPPAGHYYKTIGPSSY